MFAKLRHKYFVWKFTRLWDRIDRFTRSSIWVNNYIFQEKVYNNTLYDKKYIVSLVATRSLDDTITLWLFKSIQDYYLKAIPYHYIEFNIKQYDQK